jgi:hypothetical protein
MRPPVSDSLARFASKGHEGKGKRKGREKKGDEGKKSLRMIPSSFVSPLLFVGAFTRLAALSLVAGAFNLIARTAGNFRGGRPKDFSVLRRSRGKARSLLSLSQIATAEPLRR